MITVGTGMPLSKLVIRPPINLYVGYTLILLMGLLA